MLNQKSLNLLICMPLVAIGVACSCAQTPPQDQSKIAIMIKTLLSEGTERDIRREQARILLTDPQAHGPLLDQLQQEDNLTANIIICRTIATTAFPLATDPLPDTFVPILFKGLTDDNAELSFWAQNALARSHADSVVESLSAITTDPCQPLPSRLAAFGALELMPGKEPIHAIALLLKDHDGQLRSRAQAYLAALLAAPEDITSEQFEDRYLPKLKKLKDLAVLNRQFAHRHQLLLDAETRITQLQAQTTFWRERYFAQEAAAFGQLAEPTAKLAFLRRFLPSEQPDIFIWALQLLRDWCRTPAAQAGPIAEQLVEVLSPFVADPNPRVRELTAGSFELLGDKATPIADALIAQLDKEQSPPAQVALLKALASLEAPQAIFSALRLLDSQTPEVFTQAARTVGRIAASKPEALTDEQLSDIAASLAQAYITHDDSQNVKSELILAMGDIATPPKNIQIARRAFDDMLLAALQNDAGPVRSEAVYTLTKLHDHDVLPLLLTETDLLADPYTPVRHAVIAAIRNQGGKVHLDRLYQRLANENDIDVTRAIEDAFLAILARLSVKDSYTWAAHLRSTGEKQRRLLDRIVSLLAQQIKDAETAGSAVAPEYLQLCLDLQAQIARREGRLDQALAYYSRLLDLPIADEQKDAHRREILILALNSENGSALFTRAAPLMPELLKDAAATTLSEITNTCDRLDPSDQKQLFRRARIVAALIVPHLELIPPDQQQTWRTRITELALIIIDTQLDKIRSETPQEDPQALELLPQLDPRLSDYPADGPIADRRIALEKFRRLIQPSPPEDAQPKPAPPQPE